MKPFFHTKSVQMRAILAAAAVAIGSMLSAQAEVLYDSGGFEAARFVSALPLESQDQAPAGQGPWVRSGAGANSATITNNSNHTEGDVQIARVIRAANQGGDSRWFVSRPVEFTPMPAQCVVNIEVDLRVDQSALPTSSPVPAYGIEAYDGSALIGSATVDAVDGFLRYAQTGTAAYARVGGSAVSLGGPGAGSFHRLRLSLNFSTRAYSIYLDNVLRHTEPFVSSAVQKFTDAPIAAVSIGGTPIADTSAWFDNYVITRTTETAPPVGGALTFHPLGDSITWGYTTASAADSPGGYREPLFRNLNFANRQMDYVGANTSNPGPLLSQNLETEHDGYPKYTITDIFDNLNGSRQPFGNNQPSNNGGFWLTGRPSRPAIFPENTLLLIGTNDIEGGTTQAATIENRLDKLVARIFALRPDTHLFLANIPPYPLDANKTAIAKAYGELIREQTVPRFLAQGWKITFVDQYANFVVKSDTGEEAVNSALFGDTVHPNEAGYQRMGDSWAAAILNVPTAPPASPTALVASALSDQAIELSWTDRASNEEAFLIERSTDNVSFARIGQTASGLTRYTDAELPANSRFFYRVRARNVAGDSIYSNVADATTLPPSPSSAPTGLVAIAGSAQVSLTWSAPHGATSYNVKRSSFDGGPYAVIASPVATSYTDNTVENDRTYYYVVSANNEVGESANSSQVSATPDGRPVAWFEFEWNTLDSSGNNNHGAPAGAVLYGEGKVGANSAQFDGTGFVEMSRVVSDDFSVALWVKTVSDAAGGQWYQGMGLVDGEMVGSAADWGCSILNTKFALGIGAPDKTILTNKAVNDGQWHHLVATRSSITGLVRLYVDGVLDKVDTAAVGPRTAPNELRIGATHANPPVRFTGNLDDLRLYGRILGENEILTLAGKAPNTPPVISTIADRVVRPGSSTGPIAFTVQDAETAAGNLTLTAASSDEMLVPAGSITFGGSESNRTVTANTAPDREGAAVITVTVSDGAASASTSFQLQILAPPTITSHPQSQTVLVGSTVTFSVNATGSAPMAYQWRFNGAEIAGATEATFNFSNAQVSDAGDYSVVVTNVSGSTGSAAATLTVNRNAIFRGRAAALNATIGGISQSWSDTGPRPDSGGPQDASLLTVNQSGLIAEVARAFSLGQGDRSYSEASAANVALSAGGVTVQANFAMARALAAWSPNGTVLSGVSEISTLRVNGIPVTVSGQANQVVPLANGRLVINEQIATGATDITVTALRLVIPGVADIAVASAFAGFEDLDEPIETVGDYISGGGWITGTPSGGQGHFGFGAGVDSDGALTGTLSYKDQNSGVKLQSTSVTVYRKGATDVTRHIEGAAEVNGAGGFTFSLDVVDNGEPGREDTFALSVSNGYRASGKLIGGNIQLQ